MKKYIISLIAPFLLLISSGHAQEIVNGGFEFLNDQHMPINWIKDDGEGKFTVNIDSGKTHSGKYMLRLDGSQLKTDEKSAALAANNYGSISALKIKNIEITAWLKINSLKDSVAALFVQRIGGREIIYAWPKIQKQLIGNWQKITLSFKTNENKPWYGFYYGIELHAGATAWCDDLQLKVDGKPVTDPISLSYEPAASSLQWLNTKLNPLKSIDPGNSDEDLMPIGNLLKDVRIVGVGEPTHGTSEASRFKLRMLEYLVNQKGFTTIAMEEVIPVCDKMNTILAEKNPAIQDSLLSLPFYKCWKTKEMKELFTWINLYNQQHQQPLKFIGIDMEDQRIKNSRNMLRDYGKKYNPAILQQTNLIDMALDSLISANSKGVINAKTLRFASGLKSVLAQMDALLLSEKLQGEGDLFALQSEVRVCIQWLESRFYEGKRDLFMAENLHFYLQEHPQEKVLLWAHNFHIANASIGGEKAMGVYLKEKFGKAYFPIAITAATGKYTAAADYSQKKWNTYTIAGAYRGTYSYLLKQAKTDNYFLNLSQRYDQSAKNAWLDMPMKYLDLGYIYTGDDDNYKYYGTLRNDFDGVIFFKNTTASHSYL